MKRVDDGEYEATIEGVAVRLVRSAKPAYRRGNRLFVSTPNWNAYTSDGALLSDGNGSRKMAADNAALALRVWASAK